MVRHIFTGEERQRGGRIGYRVVIERYPEFGKRWLKKRIFRQYSAIAQAGGMTPRHLHYHGQLLQGETCPRCLEEQTT